MRNTFKDYITHQEREDFAEAQFFEHTLSRALSEAEWSGEMIMEGRVFKNFTVAKAIPHRSDHPEYDKELAYRHYGSPKVDEAATAAAVKAHGDKPGKPDKVYEHNTNHKTAGGVLGIIRNYGHPDKAAISDEDRKSEAEKNFNTFTDLRHNNPEEYEKRLDQAKNRHKDARASLPLRNTTKGDTVADLKGLDGKHKAGHISLGFSGTPDEKKHTIDDKGNYEINNACHNKGTCVSSCLAKGGCGGFESTKGKRGSIDQMDSHNESARHDHDLLMYHQLHTMSKKAKKQGKGAIVRPDTTTGHQAFTHANAIADHFGPESEHVKGGHGEAVTVNTYGKTTGTDKDMHNAAKGIHIAASDQGIPTSKGGIEAHQRLTDAMRKRGADSRNAFTVLQVAHPKDREKLSDEDYVKHAKHDDPQKQADYEKAKTVTKVRRYDLTHSEPRPGEAAEYHDEHTKSGRVVHDKKSYFYTDHDVPRPMETVGGKQQPTWMHDHRAGELERHKKEHPNDHGINAIAMATTSTNMDKTEVGKSIFHPIKNIDDKGTLHVMHPGSEEAVNARNIMARDGARSEKAK